MTYLKFVCLLIFFTCLSLQSYSQMKLGVTGGLNYSILKTETITELSNLLRYNIGVTSPILLNKFYVSPELLYSREGWGFENFDNSKGRMNLHYLDVQLLAGHYISEHFSVEIGVEYGYLFRTRRDPYLSLFDNHYNKNNWSAILGFGYHFSQDLKVAIKYIHGLSYLVNREFMDSNGNLMEYRRGTLRTIQLSCAYYFL